VSKNKTLREQAIERGLKKFAGKSRHDVFMRIVLRNKKAKKK
jgi:hypothetical protein